MREFGMALIGDCWVSLEMVHYRDESNLVLSEIFTVAFHVLRREHPFALFMTTYCD